MATRTKRSKRTARAPAGAASRTGAPGESRAKAGRKLGANTLFVLSQPADMAAADVVVAAARQGIDLSPALVHKIRSRHRDRPTDGDGRSRTIVAPSAAATQAFSASPAQYPSASAFVREQPLNRPVKEVVEEGTRLGLNVKPTLVRMIRSKMRHAGDFRPGRLAPVGGRRGRPPTNFGPVSGGTSPVEAQFRALVIQLGTVRARALMVDVERSIEAMLGAVS